MMDQLNQGYAVAGGDSGHPELFNGISASGPANWYTHIMLSFLWNALGSAQRGAFLPQDALNLITKSALDECDALDSTVDRVLEDPKLCRFDVGTLQCAPCQVPVADHKTVCLSNPQVENVRKIYAGPKHAATGQSLYPGLPLGSESSWISQESQLYLIFSVPLLQNLVFGDLGYNYTDFDWDADVDTVDNVAGPLIDHISPGLEAFRKAGGKMIVTQGWAEQLLAAEWPIRHREQMRQVSERDELQDLLGTDPPDSSNATVTLQSYPR